MFIPYYKSTAEGTYKIAYYDKSTKLEEFTTGGNVSKVTVDTDGIKASLGASKIYNASTTHVRENDSGGFISGEDFASRTTKVEFTETDGTLTTINVEELCEPKYDPLKVTFLNKFGALQELWFFKRKDRSFDVEKDSYRKSTISYGKNSGIGRFGIGNSVDFATSDHVVNEFAISAKKKVTMNTGFVTEDHNDVIKQLLVTEYCWIFDKDTSDKPTPVRPTNMTFQEKSGVNDKVMNFTVEFEYSHNYMQSVR